MNPTPAPTTPRNSHAVLSTPNPLKCLEPIAAIRPYRMRQEICRQGHAAKTWYRVLAGAASCCIIKLDGRRQIVDLLFPGDFFGFSAGAEYEYTVETAASGTIVVGYARKSIETLADSNPELTRELRQIAFYALSRRQKQLLIVGRVTVLQKVGSFILAMADRLSQDGTDRVTLPVSRYDIADYLAVSPETVSRALSELRQRRLIRFIGTRVIQIVDREALEDSDHDDNAARTPTPGKFAQLSSRNFARTANRTASPN